MRDAQTISIYVLLLQICLILPHFYFLEIHCHYFYPYYLMYLWAVWIFTFLIEQKSLLRTFET